ncbi:hypothetical protein [Desulfovibrio litoralis]|uniref:Uncharacterized protein n=1 Tax=Desulfovibrio litoralis DSM 11393 TaxID=1121455 RepID=A0A1M7T8U1_9BACT|nr:hypothetical protein [Desulfovibrio litoralis]SHN67136.1 hypothetical protein SAMN02745728_01738 [Desulfovibrio litoralis DSM 11393]
MKRKLFIVIFLIFAPVLFYKLLMQYPYYVSEQDTVSLWYPRWACGECPDMLVISNENVNNNQYVGKDVYLHVQGRDWGDKYNQERSWYKEYFSDKEYGMTVSKLVCTGRFKKNFKMKMLEGTGENSDLLDIVLYSELTEVFAAKGVFFDADDCTAVKLTEQDSELISTFIEKYYW